MYRDRFKRFGGENIPDIIEYLREYIKSDPSTTISVGCDSIQKRRKTIYAITIMLYNSSIKDGAHVIFFRENVEKIRDNFERLQRESQYCFDIGEFLNNELKDFYIRTDLTDIERKWYKYHMLKCNGDYVDILLHQQEAFVNKLILSNYEKNNEYKLVDLHVDYNPYEGTSNDRGVSKNKSNLAYRAYVPWLRGSNYRVWCKPCSPGASSAADILLKD